jgi:hypothetical protein
MSKETAKQTYQARMKEIDKRLAAIRKELDRHQREFKQDGNERDWGFSGDLGYVAHQLHVIEAFLKNEDIEG